MATSAAWAKSSLLWVDHPHLFFLPPSLGPSLESPVLEEVTLGRDEYANLAWAIERVAENATGDPLSRCEVWPRRVLPTLVRPDIKMLHFSRMLSQTASCSAH